MNLQDRANSLIAQGALTNSKRPETFIKGVYPTHLKQGHGCYVWDYQGKRYIDFITGLGCNLLGYAQEDVNQAMIKRMSQGITLSLSTEEELILAEKIKVLFPFVDCMKFLKTGTEACMAAIRIARTYTGKAHIHSDGYHGWSDEFVGLTPPALGIPKESKTNITTGEGCRSNNKIAAFILEPIGTDLSPSRIRFLRELRKICDDNKILLIFDEVITGFRFPKYSVANYLEIEPDIIILGKSIANGMPLSIVAGKKEIMNCDEYFVSSTFAGETLSLVAASKTIDLLKTKYHLQDLWNKGQEWLNTFNSFWPEMIRIEGYPTRGRFVGNPHIKALFFQEAIYAGLLFGPSWFFNFPLADKAQVSLEAIKDILCKIKTGNVSLMGEMPRSPFADQMRQTKT